VEGMFPDGFDFCRFTASFDVVGDYVILGEYVPAKSKSMQDNATSRLMIRLDGKNPVWVELLPLKPKGMCKAVRRAEMERFVAKYRGVLLVALRHIR
jgi:hypothetical protein